MLNMDIKNTDIKKIRKELNLSQSKFGEKFGIPMRTIQEWESGRRTPPDYVLNLIIENIKLQKLLTKKIL